MRIWKWWTMNIVTHCKHTINNWINRQNLVPATSNLSNIFVYIDDCNCVSVRRLTRWLRVGRDSNTVSVQSIELKHTHTQHTPHMGNTCTLHIETTHATTPYMCVVWRQWTHERIWLIVCVRVCDACVPYERISDCRPALRSDYYRSHTQIWRERERERQAAAYRVFRV